MGMASKQQLLDLPILALKTLSPKTVLKPVVAVVAVQILLGYGRPPQRGKKINFGVSIVMLRERQELVGSVLNLSIPMFNFLVCTHRNALMLSSVM